ncbi:MAG TPA: hypothetical protein VFM34_02035, partial [Moraxellaceae bacterium]|nr:hypothetical protein [Moraxellaceae bacterium]
MKILVEQTIEGLLEAKQWPAIAHYFSLHEPSSAMEFKARALQRIHLGKDASALHLAAADFEEACRRAPADPVNWINLAQCQLDIGLTDAAFASAMAA